jgi:metal-responsive CopG/Arc/MetJ family transcriptional regulator
MEARMHGIESRLEHGTPVQVRLKKCLFDAIETWRRKQETIPSRPEAIRQLLLEAVARQDTLHQQGP